MRLLRLQRRWFQFNLRTLFLLTTLFGMWLGWELHVVRERAEMRPVGRR